VFHDEALQGPDGEGIIDPLPQTRLFTGTGADKSAYGGKRVCFPDNSQRFFRLSGSNPLDIPLDILAKGAGLLAGSRREAFSDGGN
jgi:hypothetical protein